MRFSGEVFGAAPGYGRGAIFEGMDNMDVMDGMDNMDNMDEADGGLAIRAGLGVSSAESMRSA